MKAARTRGLRPILRRLADLNDQLCYHSFVDQEFLAALGTPDEVAKEQFTTEAFPHNAKADRIHVRLKDLPEFRNRTSSVSFGALSSMTYEALAVYLRTVLQDLGAPPLPKGIALEDHLGKVLSDRGQPVAPELIATLGYLRLRRNHFAHVLPRPPARLLELVKDMGGDLNAYWNEPNALDFSAVPTLTLEEGEAVAVLRVSRLVLEKLDSEVVGLVPLKPVLLRLRAAILKKKPFLGSDSHRSKLAAKLLGAATLEIGLEAGPTEIEDWLTEAAKESV